METLKIRFTRGDRMTQPGGIILRKRVHRDGSSEFITHMFDRERGSRDPTAFYWGHYIRDENKAFLDFESRVNDSLRYDTGGSLIPDHSLDAELVDELKESVE